MSTPFGPPKKRGRRPLPVKEWGLALELARRLVDDTSAMNGSQAAAFYEARQREALGLIKAHEDLNTHITNNMQVLTGQIEAHRFSLAQAYLPSLALEPLSRVKDLTGFLGFERRDPLKAMAHEKTVLEHTVARIEGDPKYQQREELASEHGTLKTKLIQIDESLAPWKTECESMESLDGFQELVHVGYDTPRFEGNWWQAMYWKYWSWGDRICKELQMDDFGDDVLPKYQRAFEQRRFWQAEADTITRELTSIHALVQEHDSSLSRIPKLPEIFLEQCQKYLGEYLSEADPGLLETWLVEKNPDRATLIALRTLAGLKAKQGFLAELRDEGLAKSLEDLRSRTTKFARKTQKYLRAKHYHRNIPDRELDHKFASKVPKLHANQEKLRSSVDRVMAYEDYGRFSLVNDPALWWVEFTGKQPPRHLTSTRRWYDRNGSKAQLEHDTGDAGDAGSGLSEAVAVAALSRDLDEVGYLS